MLVPTASERVFEIKRELFDIICVTEKHPVQKLRVCRICISTTGIVLQKFAQTIRKIWCSRFGIEIIFKRQLGFSTTNQDVEL